MKRRGVTLIELLTVIAIIGILAAVSWPTLGKVQRRERVRQYAEELANLMRSAQEQTLSEQYIYGVFIDPDNNLAELIYYGESYEGQLNYEVKETISLDSSKASITSTNIYDANSDSAIVRYNRAGLPSASGITTISDFTGSNIWDVEIIPAGSVKVYQP